MSFSILFSLFRVADIALIGLAVMGQNLILNMNDHGFVVCAYNRTQAKIKSFLENEAKGTKVIGANSLEDMVSKLKFPRIVMLLVKGNLFIIVTKIAQLYVALNVMVIMQFVLVAGDAVDEFIKLLELLLNPGDIIIDGGNSVYQDSERRAKDLERKGILFVGSGVSGGEDGARYGPSLMPGGNSEAWPHIKPIFQVWHHLLFITVRIFET